MSQSAWVISWIAYKKKKVSHLVQKLDGESSCDFKNGMSFSRINPIKPDHHR